MGKGKIDSNCNILLLKEMFEKLNKKGGLSGC
jgi:hypothetical protein